MVLLFRMRADLVTIGAHTRRIYGTHFIDRVITALFRRSAQLWLSFVWVRAERHRRHSVARPHRATVDRAAMKLALLCLFLTGCAATNTFTVERRTPPDTAWMPVATVPGNESKWTDTACINGRQCYRVKSTTVQGVSAYSAESCVD